MTSLQKDIKNMGFDKLSNKELTEIFWCSKVGFADESIFYAEQELIQRGIFEQE